jgi:hypothetical protein
MHRARPAGKALSRSIQTRPKLRGGDAPGPRRNLASRSHSIGPLGRVDSRRKDALARRPRGGHGGFLRERTACERRDRDKDVGVSGAPDLGMDLEPTRDGRDTMGRTRRRPCVRWPNQHAASAACGAAPCLDARGDHNRCRTCDRGRRFAVVFRDVPPCPATSRSCMWRNDVFVAASCGTCHGCLRGTRRGGMRPTDDHTSFHPSAGGWRRSSGRRPPT